MAYNLRKQVLPLPCPSRLSGFPTRIWRGLFILRIMRTKNSCRFTAYYKVQFWNELQMAWQDVQKQHASIDDAKSHFIAGKKCRIMEVNEKGRKPL